MDVIFEESNALKRVSYPPFLFMWTLQDLGARKVGPKLGLKSRTGARQLFYRMKFWLTYDEPFRYLLLKFEKLNDIPPAKREKD